MPAAHRGVAYQHEATGPGYAGASEFAEDLRRYLAFEPVLAVPPGALYRARKFVRRNRLGVAVGAAVALALLIAGGALAAGRL